MLKKSLSGLLGIAFGLALLTAPAFAGPDGDYDRLSNLKTLSGESMSRADGDDFMPSPSAGTLPEQPAMADPVSAPSFEAAPSAGPTRNAPGAAHLYYVTVPRNEVGNLMAVCQRHGVTPRQYYNFTKLLFFKRSGFIVDVSTTKRSFISALKRNWTALPIKSVQFKVKVTSGFKSEVGIKVGSFEEMDALLAPIVKAPYGRRTKVFKTIAQNFPGLLEKLDHVERQWFGLGKKRLFLHFPRVEVTVTGLSIKGRKKNGLLFSETYHYNTIKHAPGYKWAGR